MNYLLWNLAGPAVWPLWLAVAGLALLLWGRRRAATTALAGSALLFLLLGLSPAPSLLMASLEGTYRRPAASARFDNILVLTGGERLEATARAGSLEVKDSGDRVMRGLLLARRLPGAQLWVAGKGASAGTVSDTGETTRWWRAAGIAAARIHEITGTADTCENLAGFARSGARGTTVLVTSAFHMPRAMACARGAGITVTPFPVDYRTAEAAEWPLNVIANLETASYALHEYAGLAYYRLTGRI